ncbi:hypothetical protein ASE01_00570 [Nocardioides sp. Root190]|uniref:universal stress protein n=1 Tax=Nocardioides sp. Root190 TaxID=1736488 RepID=UPI0006FD46BA|nr:universal stress protein [Nocardioides sp. Root190]KRB80038.1 hypothetical protein ASE01_00570 [Nocardioides sp. Root190]
MTKTINPSSIVVAVDGSDDSHRAVHWAAEQAHRERRPLLVVTATGAVDVPAIAWGGMAAAYVYQPQELLARGQAVADEALAIALHLYPALEVTATAILGDPRVVLTDVSRDTHMLVLGSRGRGAFRSKVLGSVSAAVSRDAECPVVVCRPRGRASADGAGVLVGADGTAESVPVLELAFAQASLLGRPLTVMHTLLDEHVGFRGPGMISAGEPGLEEHRLLLSESVAGLRPKYPEVETDLVLARGLAEECLSDRSGTWDLIVVGRHPVDTLFRLVTGAVATAVVERAHTNVIVVPQADPRT